MTIGDLEKVKKIAKNEKALEIKVKNKYTGEIISTFKADTRETLRAKIQKIAKYAKSLAQSDKFERVAWLGKVARKIRFKKKELKNIIVAEGGLPIKYAEWEISIVYNGFKFCDWYFQFYEDKVLEDIEGQRFSKIEYHPHGVTVGITPRNTPISLPLYFLGACYLTGNPAIIKPSTACPTTFSTVFQMMQEMNNPLFDGYEIAISPGDMAIDEFIQNQLVKTFLCITASHTAKDILLRYAKYLKKSIDNSMGVKLFTMPMKHFVFEMAGNDAGIILPGVNIECVAKWNVAASFTNSGQQCFSMKRIIIHQDIYDEYVEALLREIDKIKLGDPMDPTVDIGPLGSRKILMMMEIMVEDAKKYGAKILCGAKKIDTGEDYGLFYYPTLVEIDSKLCQDLATAPFLWREEAFGPVRSVTKAKDIDDAIKLANNSNYGMRAVAYATNPSDIQKLKSELDAGNIFINTKPMIVDISFPLGGIKDSSYPPGLKYYPRELVWPKFIHDATSKNINKIS
ncbi:MAG: aldehyde dehydrogenase family protein [Candidatus Helarchaeota archaeon]